MKMDDWFFGFKEWNFSLLLGIGCVLITLSSCNREGCTDPTALNFELKADKACNSCCEYELVDSVANVHFQFTHLIGSDDFVFLRQFFAPDGRLFNIDYLKYYISNIQFENSVGTKIGIEGKVLLVTPDSLLIKVGTLPIGNYSAMEFCIGLDSITNETMPDDYPEFHPLGTDNADLYWPSGLGYQFFRFEGRVDTSLVADSIMDHNYLVQIGTNTFKRKIRIELDFDASLGSNLHFNLECDYQNLLDSLDLQSEHTTQSVTHTAVAQKIADNIPMVFSLQEF